MPKKPGDDSRKKFTYKYYHPSSLTAVEREALLNSVQQLTHIAWGKFDRAFLDKHIFSASVQLVIAYDNGSIAGFCATRQVTLLKKKVLYLEFTVVDPGYQGYGLGPWLTFLAVKKLILKNIWRTIFGSIDVMLLTPNIRALVKVAHASSKIYPNPFLANHEDGRIEQADDETWNMAQELIRQSDNPTRRLDREGLVLHDSYYETPDLIYHDENIPWHHNETVNKFAKRYLKYGEGADLEFVVRARITLRSVVNNFF